jgi:hypothetical protein
MAEEKKEKLPMVCSPMENSSPHEKLVFVKILDKYLLELEHEINTTTAPAAA